MYSSYIILIAKKFYMRL